MSSNTESTRTNRIPLVSPILWLGGKGKNWRWVVSHMPQHTVYVEPFGGGASVLLNKPPAKVEVYNDLDQKLYHLFKVLRNPKAGRRLITSLQLTLHHETEYNVAWDNPLSKENVERARQIFVQLRMAFGGLGARGKKPGFAFAKSGSKGLSTMNCVESLHKTIHRLRRVTVMSRCGIDVIKRFDSETTLHYCDPPYVPATRAKNADYKHEFSEADHRRLAETLLAVNGKVLLSGYDNDLYAEMFHKWRRVSREQALSCSRQKGQTRTEVLWMNY